MTHVSDIKLIRTDTTLDLSQKAEKGMPPPAQGAPFYTRPNSHHPCAESMWDCREEQQNSHIGGKLKGSYLHNWLSPVTVEIGTPGELGPGLSLIKASLMRHLGTISLAPYPRRTSVLPLAVVSN